MDFLNLLSQKLSNIGIPKPVNKEQSKKTTSITQKKKEPVLEAKLNQTGEKKIKQIAQEETTNQPNYLYNKTPFSDLLSSKTNYFKSTEDVRVRDFVREIPDALIKTATTVGQGLMSFSANVAGEINKKITGEDLYVSSPLESKLTGKPIGKELGLKTEGEDWIGERAPDSLKYLVGIGSVASEFWAPEKDVLKPIFKKATKEVIGELTNIREPVKAFEYLTKGFSEETATKYASKIANTDNINDTEKVIKEAYNEEVKRNQGIKELYGTNKESKVVKQKLEEQNITDSLIGSAKQTGTINTKRLGLNKEEAQMVKDEFTKAKETIDNFSGAKLTNKEVLARANTTRDKVLAGLSKEQQEEILAGMINQRRELKKSIKDGIATKEMVDALVDDKSISQFSGRLLQARNIDILEPEEKTLIEKMFNDISKVENDQKLIKKEMIGVDFNDIEQATEFYRKFIKPKAEEWVDILRYNSMLSNPVTWLSNIVSSVGQIAVRPVVKTLAGGIDAGLSLLKPSRQRKQFAGEGLAYLKAMRKSKSYSAATEKLMGVWNNNIEDVIQDFGLNKIPLTQKGTTGRMVENVLKSVGKIMESSDQFLLELAKRGEKEAGKYRVARGGIIQKGDVKEQAQRSLFRNKLVDPADGYVLNAIGTIGELVNQARRAKNPIVRWSAKFFVPFIQFATKGVQTGIEFNPLLGWTTLAGARNPVEQAAKSVVGLGVATSLYALYSNGGMTGAAPISQADKTKWADAGIQPYSIKIGDTWISYDKLPPWLSFTFATMATLNDALEKGNITDDEAGTIWSAFVNSNKFFTDQSFMKSIGNVVDAFKGDENAMAQLLSNPPSQMVPFKGLLTWIERLTDGKQRIPNPNDPTFKKQIQYFAMQIPGLAQTVPERRNVEGQVVENPLEQRIMNAFSPIKFKEQTPEQEQLTKFLDDIDNAKKYQSISIKDEKRKLNDYVDQFLSAPTPEERNNILLYVYENDPLMVDKVLDKLENTTLPKEAQYLKSLNVNGRAKFIYDQLKRTKPEERSTLLVPYYSAGILTDDVLDNLDVLIAQETK